ncbi:MAG: hypothetical protein HYY40_12780 [Bacteroidetes bacterium]|nr:hypothetical protein [Bacteroidota bacterium]
MKIEGIKEFRQGELTLMTAGRFDNYDAAKSYRDTLAAMNVPSPFVVAINQEKKVPLKQAISYTKKKMAAKKEKGKKKKQGK